MDSKCHKTSRGYKCISSVPTKADKSYPGLRMNEERIIITIRNARPTILTWNNFVQLCVGSKTCLRSNAILKRVNYWTSARLFERHKMLPIVRKICAIITSRSWESVESTIGNYVKVLSLMKGFILQLWRTRLKLGTETFL